MRALFLLPLALLAGCTGTTPVNVLPPPVTVANATVLDEKAATAVELSYKAMRLAMETAIDAGYLRGENARKAADLDNRAYAAVLAVRSAYNAGNAADYNGAVANAISAVGAATAAVKGN